MGYRQRNTLFRDFDKENKDCEYESLMMVGNEWRKMGAYQTLDKNGQSLPMDGRVHRYTFTDGTTIDTVNKTAEDVKHGDKVFLPGHYVIHTSDGRGLNVFRIDQVPAYDKHGRQCGFDTVRTLTNEKDYGFTVCSPKKFLQVITNYKAS